MKRIFIMLGLAALLALIGGRARAHSFYAPECCSDGDCSPLPRTARIVATPDGGYDVTVKPGAPAIHFTRDRLRPSQDDGYHGCVSPAGYAWCLYIPLAA